MSQKKNITKRQLHGLLMSEENTISIEKAIEKSKKKWKKWVLRKNEYLRIIVHFYDKGLKYRQHSYP